MFVCKFSCSAIDIGHCFTFRDDGIRKPDTKVCEKYSRSVDFCQLLTMYALQGTQSIMSQCVEWSIQKKQCLTLHFFRIAINGLYQHRRRINDVFTRVKEQFVAHANLRQSNNHKKRRSNTDRNYDFRVYY